jgi:hypothetical protein
LSFIVTNGLGSGLLITRGYGLGYVSGPHEIMRLISKIGIDSDLSPITNGSSNLCQSCDSDDDKYYVGDIGTEILVDTCSDLTGATSVSIVVEKPNGDIETWSGTVSDTRYISYIVMNGDFDQSGEYWFQARVVFPSWSGSGNMGKFYIRPIIGG